MNSDTIKKLQGFRRSGIVPLNVSLPVPAATFSSYHNRHCGVEYYLSLGMLPNWEEINLTNNDIFCLVFRNFLTILGTCPMVVSFRGDGA